MTDVDHREKWRAFTAIGISFVTAVFSTSMVFVALPAIADDFDVTLGEVGWVVIVEALTVASVMLPAGRVADLVGRRRMHLWGLAVFGTGALAVSLAPTFGLLIAARVVMAVGNSMGQSVGTAMIVAIFPPEERGRSLGAQTSAVAIGAASGPILGGLLLSVLPWQALFQLLLLPIAVAFVAGVRLLREDQVTPLASRGQTRFDPGGAILSALFFTVIVLVMNNPLDVGWTSPAMLLGMASAVGVLAGFVAYERRVADPMLDVRLFANRTFALAVGARLFGFTGSTLTYFLTPILLIAVRDLEEAAAGAIMLLNSLGMGIAAQLSGRTSDRYGPTRIASVGLVVMAGALAVFAAMDVSTPLLLFCALVFVQGFSLGSWNVPNNSTIISSVDDSDHGVVGAFTNLTRTMGNVVGQAMATVIVASVMDDRGFDIPLGDIADVPGAGDAFVSGWSWAFGVGASCAVLAAACTLLAGRTPRRLTGVRHSGGV